MVRIPPPFIRFKSHLGHEWKRNVALLRGWERSPWLFSPVLGWYSKWHFRSVFSQKGVDFHFLFQKKLKKLLYPFSQKLSPRKSNESLYRYTSKIKRFDFSRCWVMGQIHAWQWVKHLLVSMKVTLLTHIIPVNQCLRRSQLIYMNRSFCDLPISSLKWSYVLNVFFYPKSRTSFFRVTLLQGFKWPFQGWKVTSISVKRSSGRSWEMISRWSWQFCDCDLFGVVTGCWWPTQRSVDSNCYHAKEFSNDGRCEMLKMPGHNKHSRLETTGMVGFLFPQSLLRRYKVGFY